METPLSKWTGSLRATARAVVFFLKVFPMLPSRPVDWVTPRPVVDSVCYPTTAGFAHGDLYRPATPGPHPGILVCLGVVPFGVDHPQVPVLGNALARAGLAALLYWSPAMRDFRLDPKDIDNLALAYDWFIQQPNVDGSRSGMLGTCVGGSFALMAAAHALIRDRVAFIGAYAPFASMDTFAADIASGSTDSGQGRRPWLVDQLTRRVFVHSITAGLEPVEAERLRAGFAVAGSQFDDQPLSPDGRQILALLRAKDVDAARTALRNLPPDLQARLRKLSPLHYLADIHAPLVVQLHDRGDQLIPVGESRRLHAALPRTRFTEMNFSHLDPVKGKLPLPQLLREFAKFFRAVLPLFRLVA